VSWAPVAHACKPNYSGGRDQEDFGSKPAWAKSLQDTTSKIPITKKGLVEWLKVKVLSSSPSTTKKKKVMDFQEARLKNPQSLCFSIHYRLTMPPRKKYLEDD
jgi:hypothetical protein